MKNKSLKLLIQDENSGQQEKKIAKDVSTATPDMITMSSGMKCGIVDSLILSNFASRKDYFFPGIKIRDNLMVTTTPVQRLG